MRKLTVTVGRFAPDMSGLLHMVDIPCGTQGHVSEPHHTHGR